MTFPRAGYVIAAMLVCMAADVALYIAVRGMAQRSELKVRNDILSAQIDRQKEHYTAITAQYETIRRMRHDIAKNLYTMQALLHAERYQDAAAYLSEVSAQTQVQERLGVCENPIVDAYIFSRSQELEKQEYRVQLRVRLPEAIGISNSDLIIAFANLLVNAADACHACEDKTISLTAAVNKGFLTIETENACRTQLQTKKRRIPELERGIGFSIFQELARKYDGSFSYHTENGHLRRAAAPRAACAVCTESFKRTTCGAAAFCFAGSAFTGDQRPRIYPGRCRRRYSDGRNERHRAGKAHQRSAAAVRGYLRHVVSRFCDRGL